jgi:Protein of unknown function (DUF3822)
MHDIRFIDEAFDIKKISGYHLSIQAGIDGLSYTIFDPTRYKYIILKHFRFGEEIPEYKYPDSLKKLLNEDEFLQNEFQSVYCIWNNPRTTLLPAVLFEKEKIRQYFEFNQVLNDHDELHSTHIKSLDAYLIFTIHHEIANVFIRQYPSLKFFNQASPFIEHAMHVSDENTDSAHLNIHNGFFDMLVIRNKSLVLHNTFNYRNENDIAYFAMNVFDKVSLDPANIPIYISGAVEKNSEKINRLRNFIKTIRFSSQDNRFHYSYTFDRIPEHWFITLFNLYLCG